MKMRMDKKYNKMFFYALGIVAVACAFLSLLLNFSYVKGFAIDVFFAFKPVLYAVIFVFCVGGLVNTYYSFFEKRMVKGKRTALAAKVLSVVLGYLSFLLIIAALLIIVVLPLVSSYSDILAKIPEYISNAKLWLKDTVTSIPLLSHQSEEIMDYINDSLNFSYDSLQKYAPTFMGMINKLLSEASNILLGLIISIYIVCSRGYISKVRDRLVRAFLSEDMAERTHRAMVSIYGYFTDFFSCRLLYSLIIGIVFYIVLWAMEIPLYSFISIMIGVLVFVPVVGTIIAFALSTFFVFITSYNLVLWFIVVYTVILLIGYLVLGKYIIRENVRTTVTASLIAVLVFYGLLGTIGAVLAIPVYLSCKLAFKSLLISLENGREAKNSEREELEDDLGEV